MVGLLVVATTATGAAALSTGDCQATTLAATAKRARAVFRCYAQAAVADRDVDEACVAKATNNFSRAVARLASDDTCRAAAEAVEADLSAFMDVTMDAIEDGARDRRCLALTLRATGDRTDRVLKAHARMKRTADYTRLARDVSRGAANFVTSLQRAENSGVCESSDDAATLGGRVDALARDLLCGDGVRDLGEDCDASDDAICPGACTSACTCTSFPAFSCLGPPGNVIPLSGIFPSAYRNASLAPGTKIDARQAVFLGSPDNRYPVNVGGAGGACLAGGTVLGEYGRRLTWDQMHDMNNAGVAFEAPGFTVDGLRIDNVTDGIRPEDGPFTIRQAWLSYVRDDCVENDHLEGGSIDDSLFDGCYVAISERPTPGAGYDGRSQLLTVRRSLLRLQAMPGPRGGAATDFGHGRFFKWDDHGTQLALHDNVFLAEKVGEDGAASMGIPSQLVSCSNNVMVWLGGGPYPAALPSCFRITTDRGVWDTAVAAWKARHPYVGAP